ncbi:hypothetical protein QYM36_005001 [Artemia franciscana]|uniref:DML1/Misato tubulin domain-containing protein n=1 Tax=Artemia franciscana TaxID=6661 RepID=A0AA88L5K6_ARTSF|nr:hypothetical protein QYM36_005001 [Artemia franciscana]
MSSISQKMFDDRMKALEKKLDFIISKQSELAITVSSISDEVQILKNESKSRDSKIVFLENQLEEQMSRCDTIEAKLLEMEVKDRKLNLIIHGLSKEKQQQTVFANVSTLFSSTMEIMDKVQILQCYRMFQKSNVSTQAIKNLLNEDIHDVCEPFLESLNYNDKNFQSQPKTQGNIGLKNEENEMAQVIKGGNVPILEDKWLVEKSLAASERSYISTDNSPSPWIPFGQTIPQFVKNFKSLQTKDTKEDKDFKEKRHTTLKDIQSEKKTFSRNVKSVNDHVQDVIVAGFTFAQAKGDLHKTKGNVDNAIELLRNQQKNRSFRYRKDDDHYEGSSSARPLALSLGDFLQVGKDKTPISHKTKQSHNPQMSSRGARTRMPSDKGLTSGRVKEFDQLPNAFQSWPHLQDDTQQWPGLDEAIEGSKATAVANPAPSNTQTAGDSNISSTTGNRNLESHIKVWTDYLRPHFHPKSILLTKEFEYQSPAKPFNFFDSGVLEWNKSYLGEDIEDSLRFFAEGCDVLQGFQLLFDAHDGFSGVAEKTLELIHEEYGKKTTHAFPVMPSRFSSDTQEKAKVRLINIALSFNSCIEHTFFTPLTLAKTYGLSAGKGVSYVNYIDSCDYHTSAIIASALDTLTLPYRLKNSNVRWEELLNLFSQSDRKLSTLNVQFPFVMNEDESLLELLGKSQEDVWTTLCPSSKSNAVFSQSIVFRGLQDSKRRRYVLETCIFFRIVSIVK